MIVVSDTSPLTALLITGHAEILPTLFREVAIPEAVRDELLRKHPILPQWLKIIAVTDRTKVIQYLETVDAGEAEAIGLARQINADHLLIDERKGRRLASHEGVAVIGLLGVVLLAKRNGVIYSARHLLDRVQREGGLYLSGDIREAALKSVGE
jgi:uncharacterized protein